MRQKIKDFISIISNYLPNIEPIYEFGSYKVSGQEDLADLRPLFPQKEYVGADMRKGKGVDIILNLHDIDLPPESVGTVLCLDTLEHVEYPHRALIEIHRILKPDGIVVISSVMFYPIHDHPNDYWRFTPEAFKSLLKPFKDSFIGFAGEENFPHTVVGIGFKGPVPPLSEFRKMYEIWHEGQKKSSSKNSLKKIAKLITPPVFIPALSKLNKVLMGLTRNTNH
jgi:SAM-dependent methyltransferase